MRGESRVEASRGGEGGGATFVEENACPRGLPAFPTKARQKRSSVTGRARSRQVFGLTSAAIVTDRFPTGHRFPGAGAQCFVMTFVLDYRCGAVPDSHRVPFSARGTAAQRAPIASDRILRRVEGVNRSARPLAHAVRSTSRARSSLDAASSFVARIPRSFVARRIAAESHRDRRASRPRGASLRDVFLDGLASCLLRHRSPYAVGPGGLTLWESGVNPELPRSGNGE